MIPGPRPAEERSHPLAGRGDRAPSEPLPTGEPAPLPVALTRTPQGWAVVSPDGLDPVGDLVEGLSLADLVAEELGAVPEPDRSARRSARGPGRPPAEVDPVAARIAALERTVAQLEHALAARVATERAIGVLAERHGTGPRAAFENLRREARSQGRPVAELAREVLEGLAEDAAPAADPAVPVAQPAEPTPPLAIADGRS
ncbi:ANTAR domain-containing protein [Blastococcus sp. TF02A-30]|uniref:ANTAR domain-containing protein n=1 Tax=Blastococcus sp. TF02A-30 TaxID=2250580 RepID=UPI000DEB2687|nr:ANTAR domain-containing protein [Blastococcus sp. TF02A-30]RBY86499.1 transcription antitermination regulator [Blastococcus sp. TF02A-30]